jgi:hypothetical protein
MAYATDHCETLPEASNQGDQSTFVGVWVNSIASPEATNESQPELGSALPQQTWRGNPVTVHMQGVRRIHLAFLISSGQVSNWDGCRITMRNAFDWRPPVMVIAWDPPVLLQKLKRKKRRIGVEKIDIVEVYCSDTNALGDANEETRFAGWADEKWRDFRGTKSRPTLKFYYT